MKNLLLACLLVSTLFSSCKKEDSSTSQPLTTASVSNTVVTGSWKVTYYYDTDHDATSSFAGYEFDFATGGVVTATKAGTTITGSWSSGTDDDQVKLILSFSAPSDFSEISDDWHVIERTDTRIKLLDISGGNGGTDYLTFERN